MTTATAPERRREFATGSAAQILWLLAALAIAVLPHLPHVALWIPPLIAGLCTWRLLAARRCWPLPSVWLRLPMAIAGFTGVLVTYRQVTGLDAGSALLMVMAAMKLLETRGHRDRAVVIFLCCFLLFAAFLREQALWSPIYLCTGILVVIAALLQVARRDDTAGTGPSPVRRWSPASKPPGWHRRPAMPSLGASSSSTTRCSASGSGRRPSSRASPTAGGKTCPCSWPSAWSAGSLPTG